MLEWFATNAVAIATAVFTALTLFIVMRNDIKNLFNGHKQIRQDIKAIASAISSHQKDDIDEFARIRREFGETTQAVRTKIVEIELFSRDTFMRRDSGYKMQEALQSEVRGLGEEIKNRLERMENKIDTKT